MTTPHDRLDEQERAALSAAMVFLSKRLSEKDTIDWALGLKSNDVIHRNALRELINSPVGYKLKQPWRDAWRLIEHSWNSSFNSDWFSTNLYRLRNRIQSDDRSRTAIDAIVDLVQPRLKIRSLTERSPEFRRTSTKRPRKIADLFSATLTSGDVVDPEILGLQFTKDTTFLRALAYALEAAIDRGLDIARCVGWNGKRYHWKLGQLYRVYYVPKSERLPQQHEPDEFHRGIAPATKLLHSVVKRVAEIHAPTARELVGRVKRVDSYIYARLWAALSTDPRITSIGEVSAFVRSLDARLFWDVYDYPEVALLRATRFGELSPRDQSLVSSRIKRGPPSSLWPKDLGAQKIHDARIHRSVREFRRIEVGGSSLPQRYRVWLTSRIAQFPDLAEMMRLDEDFPGTPQARWVLPNPDSRYDLISGEDRLKALEVALSSTRTWWDDDARRGATDWMRSPKRASLVLSDLEAAPKAGASFCRVWERFGWSHSAPREDANAADNSAPVSDGLRDEVERVLLLLVRLPAITLREAIDGLSEWLSAWRDQVVASRIGVDVWRKMWPVAADLTNATKSTGEEANTSKPDPNTSDETVEVDALNTSVGKLVGVFLSACPNLNVEHRPFAAHSAARDMRDDIVATSGYSNLIGLWQMIRSLEYFFRADRDWTKRYLISSLISGDPQADTLWSAIARGNALNEVLECIGEVMAQRANDPGLGRETRQSLAIRITREALVALLERRPPRVLHSRTQQMIRSLEDEVRAHVAESIFYFQRNVPAPDSAMHGDSRAAAGVTFLSSVSPFLTDVWPQERSLVTPEVSRAFAGIPAAAGSKFAEAVNVVERFLVPFECWSIHDYGFYGEQEHDDVGFYLSIVDTREKAAALLRLLDLTIGTTETAVVPFDLSDALGQVRKVAPDLADSELFRRLAAAARRS